MDNPNWRCYDAASEDDLPKLIRLRQDGSPWNQLTFIVAARNGNIRMLAWLLRNGCPVSQHVTEMAALHGKTETLDWLVRNGLEFNVIRCIEAATIRGHKSTAVYIKQHLDTR